MEKNAVEDIKTLIRLTGCRNKTIVLGMTNFMSLLIIGILMGMWSGFFEILVSGAAVVATLGLYTAMKDSNMIQKTIEKKFGELNTKELYKKTFETR